MDVAGRKADVDGRRVIELDVARTTYRTLLTRIQEAHLQRDMARMQIGEQLVMIEPARLPEQPMGPSRALGRGQKVTRGRSLVWVRSVSIVSSDARV